MRRLRRLYGISPDEAEEDRLLEQRRVDLAGSLNSGWHKCCKHRMVKDGQDAFEGDIFALFWSVCSFCAAYFASGATKIHSALTLLDKNNLIKYDKRTGQVQVPCTVLTE